MLTSQAGRRLFELVGAGPGVRLLDIACGPGNIAAQALARGCTVTGRDFSMEMVRRARDACPGGTFMEGDAEELPDFSDSPHAAVMNFGMLHLGRPEQAMSQAHRVLRSGGRFAFTVWAPPTEALGFGVVLEAVENHGEKVTLPEGAAVLLLQRLGTSDSGTSCCGFL